MPRTRIQPYERGWYAVCGNYHGYGDKPESDGCRQVARVVSRAALWAATPYDELYEAIAREAVVARDVRPRGRDILSGDLKFL